MTRELWLEQATDRLREGLFKQNGFEVPKARVSVGFPGGGSARKRIGEHWHPRASDDQVSQVFISPVLSDAVQVLDVLAHELVHAIVPDAGHKAPFRAIAVKIGLTGKMTATVAGPELKAKLEALGKELVEYPHSKINLSGRKKQTTRLLKAWCNQDSCRAEDDKPYTVRITRKWLDEYGAPICPNCNARMWDDRDTDGAEAPKEKPRYTEADIPF
jgi:hypothetical protein